MSVYRSAIDQTATTIERRAAYYRNLVVGVVLVAAASAGASMWLGTFAPVCGVLFVIPLCGLYFYLDARLVLDWQSGLSGTWVRGAIDFAALTEALRAAPTLPRGTLTGMLAQLPPTGALAAERRIPLKSREAMAAVIDTVQRARTDLLAARTGASTVGVLSVLCAIALGSWRPLSFCGLALLFHALAEAVKRYRLRQAHTRTLTLRDDPTFDPRAFERFVHDLDCTPFSVASKRRFIAGVRTMP